MTVFFGQHLLDKGLVSQDNLNKALEIQSRGWVALGQLAINEGLIQPEQVAKILSIQKNGAHDLRFGEIACREGFLTTDQVERLVTLQKNKMQLLGNILVEQGFLTPLQLIKELRAHEALKSK